MAEYRALAQNTYKFVTEKILLHAGNIGALNEPQKSRVKIIQNGEVLYSDIVCHGDTCTETATGSRKAATSGSGGQVQNAGAQYVTTNPVNAFCIVDGKKYSGTKNAYYLFHAKSAWVNMSSSASTTIDINATAPTFLLKVVMYVAAEGSISTKEYKIDAMAVSAVTIKGYSASYAFGYQYMGFKIAKETDDIILAISVEYDAHDITISGSGLQYSLDDGVTFADVTSGLTLEQVEHVVFKNTGNSTRNVGTTEGGTDVVSVIAGATSVAVPTVSGTWYIS